MRVLSLFDGMSCGQIALRDMGIVPEAYYASEVDKFAIAQTQLNFPDTIQLGDVRQLNVENLIGGGKIDLLIGGSPCQSFSFAGACKGMTTKENEKILSLDRYLELKEQGFEFEGQSYLFWEYMRILAELRKHNPDIKFLLENVKMKKEWERVLTEAIGVPGVLINSNLVSAQNRQRIFWTNIASVQQPKDRGVYLRDILEHEVDEKYFVSEKMMGWLLRHASKRGTKMKIWSGDDKGGTITATAEVKGSLSTNWIKDMDNGRIRKPTPTECARMQTVPSWYKWGCSDTQCYKLLGNGWTVEVIKHIFSYLNK